MTSLRAEAENPKQQWRTNKSWLYVGTRSCIYIFVLLQKQEYILQPDWSCLAEATPMTRIRACCVVNFTRDFASNSLHSRVKFTNVTQQTRIRVMGGASARQLQSGCKMYSCFCKSTKMYIQLRVPTYNHDLFVQIFQLARIARKKRSICGIRAASFAQIAPQDCLSRLCIDLTCKSFARFVSFASGVNAP